MKDFGNVRNQSGNQVQLAERLREAREYLGLSQEYVASKTGIPRPAVSAIENGKRRVEALELQALASLYKHPVDYFLRGTTDIPDSVRAIAREAVSLTARDREEVLRFTQFLKGYESSAPGNSRRPTGSAE